MFEDIMGLKGMSEEVARQAAQPAPLSPETKEVVENYWRQRAREGFRPQLTGEELAALRRLSRFCADMAENLHQELRCCEPAKFVPERFAAVVARADELQRCLCLEGIEVVSAVSAEATATLVEQRW